MEYSIMEMHMRSIADHYGVQTQELKAIEELTELASEIFHLRGKAKTTKALITELADVEIMLYQIKYLCGVNEEELEEEKINKITRQLHRIEQEKEEE